MKKIVLIPCMLFLTACQNGLLMTRGDIREQENNKKVQDTVSTTQRAIADNNTRFADMESDMRALNGRLEVAEARTQQLINERQQMKTGYDTLSNEQSKKILILQEEVAKLQDQVAQLTAEMNAVRVAGASESVAEKSAPKDAFQIAEDSFEKHDWKKAILNYNKFRDSNPKHKRFGEATYKIGVSFQELGMKDEARTFYEEVVAKYPNSADAKKARSRLKSLKK